MIIRSRSKCGYFLVRTCARRLFPEEFRRRKILMASTALAGAAAVVVLSLLPLGGIITLPNLRVQNLKALFLHASEPDTGSPLSRKGQPPGGSRPAASQSVRPSHVQDGPKPHRPEILSGSARSDKKPATPPEAFEAERSTHPEETSATEKPLRIAAIPPAAGDDEQAVSRRAAAHTTILGQITLRHNETLSKVIQNIYGYFNSKYFRSLILANPDIEDPDRVEVGQIVSMPAIPVEVTPLDRPVWWVKFDDVGLLEDAYNVLRNYPENSASLCLIPHWTAEHGLQFSVVLNKLFTDEASAHDKLASMPAGLISNSEVVSTWDKGSIYFADPYFGRKH